MVEAQGKGILNAKGKEYFDESAGVVRAGPLSQIIAKGFHDRAFDGSTGWILAWRLSRDASVWLKCHPVLVKPDGF